MKHHPSGSLKNIMVFTALANIMLYISMAFFSGWVRAFPASSSVWRQSPTFNIQPQEASICWINS